MTGKRKRHNTGLQELIDRPWCYYCLRDFDDQQVLQTHQREMHFQCDYCNRKLNTANGLCVHTQQVHKFTVTEIHNAIEGRQSPGIEVFGVNNHRRTLGIPEDVAQKHRQEIIDGYYALQAQHRARTGNPLPGTVQHDPNKKGKRDETPAEAKARLLERMAAKKAAKEAAANGDQKTQPPDIQPPVESNASPPAALQTVQTTETLGTPAMYLPSSSSFYPAMPTLPAPLDISAFQPHPPMMSVTPPNVSNGYPYGYPPGYPHGVPTTTNYGAGFYNYPMPAMHNAQVPRTSYSPPTMTATQFSMPSAPGLPQRPSFDAPSLTKTEMASLHTQGPQHAPAVVVSSSAAAPPAREPTPPAPAPAPKSKLLTRPLDMPPEIVTDKAIARGQKIRPLDLLTIHHGKEEIRTVKDEVLRLFKNKSGAFMLWFPSAAFGLSTFEEIKRIAPEYQFDETTGPTETTIAQ